MTGYAHKGFVSASLWFLHLSITTWFMWSRKNWNSVSRSVLLANLKSQPHKTLNSAPAHNCNSRFPPLFSAQIPKITAKKKPHSASRQTYWGHSSSCSTCSSCSSCGSCSKCSSCSAGSMSSSCNKCSSCGKFSSCSTCSTVVAVVAVVRGVVNGKCETLRDGETSGFLCELFRLRDRDFKVF